MSEIIRASSDATEAARQSDQFAIALAAVHAAQQHHQHEQSACRHHGSPAPAAPGGGGVKWLAVGMGGSALLLSVAVSAVAVAVSAVAVTVCLLVLRSVLADVRKGR